MRYAVVFPSFWGLHSGADSHDSGGRCRSARAAGCWNDGAAGLRSRYCFALSSFRHGAEFFPALASNIDRSVGSL